MNLDEQIAWLEDKACESLRDAKACEAFDFTDASTSTREEAAMLLTIENTLRAMRDGVDEYEPVRWTNEQMRAMVDAMPIRGANAAG